MLDFERITLKAYNPCIVPLQVMREVVLLDQHHDRSC